MVNKCGYFNKVEGIFEYRATMTYDIIYYSYIFGKLLYFIISIFNCQYKGCLWVNFLICILHRKY